MHDESRRPKAVYKCGPYEEGGRSYWKVVVEYCRPAAAKRSQTSKRVATEDAADALVEEVQAAIAAGYQGSDGEPQSIPNTTRTYGDLVDEFMKEKRKELAMGGQETVNKLRNLDVTAASLRGIVSNTILLGDFTPRVAARVFKTACQRKRGALDTELADATKVIYFSRLRALFEYGVEQQWVRSNPFAGLPMPKVKVRKGKKQLRLDQSRLFKKVALEEIRTPDSRARAKGIPVCVTTLLLALAASSGCRIGELLDCEVQDLDNGGTLLWIDRGKTKNARRYIDVVDYLQPFVGLLAKGRAAQAPLFPSHVKTKHGEAAPTKTSVLKKLKLLLRRANLPEVCTHSLRGTFMSITAPRLGLSREYAAAVGHGDSGQTAQSSYMSAEARQELRQRSLGAAQEVAARLLSDETAAGPQRGVENQSLAEMSPEQLLLALSPEQIDALRTMIGRKRRYSKGVSETLPREVDEGDSDDKIRDS